MLPLRNPVAAHANGTSSAGHGRTAPSKPPIVRPLVAGAVMLRAPSVDAAHAANRSLTNVSAAAEHVTLEALVGDAEARRAPVFSLELDLDGFGAYIVNGMLVID